MTRANSEELMHRCLMMMACLIATTTTASAADGEPQGRRTPPTIQRETPDFLFGPPRATVSVRAGWVFARTDSDWFDFVTDQLTLEPGDFDAPTIAADVGFALAPRVDAVAGVAFSQASAASEYRRLVDNNRQPIEQRTRVRQTSITGSLEIALTPRGRQVGSLAWVPKPLVPYVGAGGGAAWYDLRQAGDFVDFVDNSVFTDVFQSQGWAPTGHVFGGMDIQLTRRLFATVEGRYDWTRAELGDDWVGFEPIDLSGFHLTGGVSLLF